MHRVEMLEQLLTQAAGRGYTVRQEWLGGRGGGACEIAGKKHLFIDLALTLAEQLAQAADALRDDPSDRGTAAGVSQGTTAAKAA